MTEPSDLPTTVPPHTRVRRQHRWRWLLVVAVLVGLLIVFLPQWVLVHWGPRLLGTVLSEQLHTPVTVEGVAGGWLSGLEIQGIEVAESPESQAPLLLRLERLSLNLAALWLLASSEPMVLRLEELTVNLRRRPDGQWNIAALRAHPAKPTPSAAPTPLKLPAFLDRRLDLTLAGGQLHMGEDGSTYRFDLQAESPSLVEAPWQWQFALSGPADAALTVDGQLQHLVSSEPLAGHAEVKISQLDFDVVTALLPWHTTLQPRGRIQEVHVRLEFEGTQGVHIAAGLAFQQLQWQAASSSDEASLDWLQVRLQGQWQDNQWSCDTLSIEAPGGRFALRDRAWMQADADAWRGHMAIALDIKEGQPAIQALQTLLPPALHIQGPLQLSAQADGAIRRDPQQPWDARLAGLEASLDAALAGITWSQKTVTRMVTRVFLKDGWLRIPEVSAKALGSDFVLKGELPLAEDTPGAGIDWRVVNLPVHKVLGKPLQHFVVSQSSGRLTRDGKGYRIQNVVRFPELRLDPAELDEREFRIMQAVFRCTATLSLPFTHLAFDGCTIESPEMRLAIHQGKLVLGGQPQISLQLKGDLSGGFVNALVPEVPVQFTHPLHVSGPYSIRLQGNVWVGMQWELAVTSKRFVFADMPFTDLGTRVVKRVGGLDIADVKAKRGNGHVEGSGSWRFPGKGQTAEGHLHLLSHRLPMQRLLRRDARGDPYTIEAIVDGPTTVQTGPTGWQLTGDKQLHHLRLRQGTSTLAELPVAHVSGRFGRERHGSLWAHQLEIVGDDLQLAIRQGRLPLQVTNPSGFEVDATVQAPAPWVMSLLALLQVKGVEVAGQTQVIVRVQGKMPDAFQTLQGSGSVQVAEALFHGQSFTPVEVAYELAAGRLQIRKGVVGYGDGRIEVQGSLGLPPRLGTSGDHGVVILRQIPLEHTQPVQDFRSQGPATLHLQTTGNGHMELQVTRSGQLKGVLQGQTDKTIRQVRQGDQILEEVAVPSLVLTSQVSSARPQEQWEFPSLRLQGQGISIELKQVDVSRTPSHIDLSGALQVHLSREASHAVTMGVLPAAFELRDTVDLSGTAGLHIPVTGPIEPRHLSYAGDVHLQNLLIEGDTSESLTARLNLQQGRLTVDAARADMLDGEVSIASSSFVDLQGPVHDFDVHAVATDLQLQVHGGKRLALSRILFLLAPLFIIEPHRDEPASMSGALVAEMALSGSFSEESGWSKTVNGEGFFRIVDGAIQGSTLVSGLTTKTLMLPWNTVHNSLTGLFAADGRVGSEIASLGREAFVFGTLESPIQVRAGAVHLKPNFEVRSPEFGMVINGSSTLEGDLDYRVRTDLIERLRFGSITSLPNRLPVIGNVLRYVNPFTLLEGIELEATVQGNAFRKNAEGKIDINVHTSILR